jgi:uridine phosphorylase
VDDNYSITPEFVVLRAMEKANKSIDDFKVEKYAIVFFSTYFLEYLRKNFQVNEDPWLSPYHPYASSMLYRIQFKNVKACAICPPMGASSMACVVEDLIYNGATLILLACGAWGIKEDINLLDFMIPTHTLGYDGTSVDYSRSDGQEIPVSKKTFDVIKENVLKEAVQCHIGKNCSKEAFYKINKDFIFKAQKMGCISMENGELNIIATIANNKNVQCGALLYNYFNPLQGWKIPWLNKRYREVVFRQCKIALSVIESIANNDCF